MKRRTILKLGAGAFATLLLPAGLLARPDKVQRRGPFSPEQTTLAIYADIIEQAQQQRWNELPIGELLAKVARLFLGYQYKGGTLENPTKEICKVDFTGLDCVTLYENALCIARVLKKGRSEYSDFLAEIEYTRYRGGKLTDYASRLHYTSDWIYDNVKKGVVEDISKELGGVALEVHVDFMSTHPQYYKALGLYPELIGTIAGQEKAINSRKHWYIPQANIAAAEEDIHTGDIIAIVTNKAGLDYAHTGIAYRDDEGLCRLLHASSNKKEVVLDGRISGYVQSVTSHIGISVLRPLSVQ